MICPRCGSPVVEDIGTIFIEDGPWTGKEYANEGDFARYQCKPCGFTFAEAPAPLICGKCGGQIYGELGEDCEQLEDEQNTWLCERCMTKEVKA